MYNALRNINIDRLDIGEAMALRAFGRSLAGEYNHFGIDIPEWLLNNLDLLDADIKTRHREELKLKLRREKEKFETYKTASEKRKESQDVIKRLEEALA